MNKRLLKIVGVTLLFIALVTVAVVFFKSVNVAVLNPQGEVADKERNLIVFTLLLSAVVVIPVFILLGVFAWKYRAGNTKAIYRPDWDSNRLLESIWWGIPCAIILILSVVAWRTTHELDPYKTLDSNVKSINVQVVALQWKWLFIYPDQHIASVNLLQFPEKTAVNFTITADAPMNSLWIPSLGGQVYAMSGMSTQLHLIADRTGDYHGSSANISGKGFADMAFIARASTESDFNTWVQHIQRSGGTMDISEYNKLSQPGTNKQPVFYSLKDDSLYDKILMKYMAPMPTNQNVTNPSRDENSQMKAMPGMEGM